MTARLPRPHGDWRNQALPGLCQAFAARHNELVRVVATRIEWDGTMQRRMVDTARRSGGRQWEELAARALAVPPPYRPVPGTPIYHVGLDDGTAVIVAEHDLCDPLLDLVTAVLAMGEEMLSPAGLVRCSPDHARGAMSRPTVRAARS
jgi:hypothetical protein